MEFFEVEKQSVITQGGAIVPKKQAVVRTDTNEVLSIVSNRYKLVNHEDAYVRAMTAIAASTLDTNGMTESIDYSYGGARMIAKIKFPEHRVTIQNDDEVDLQLNIHNSYDGSKPFTIDVGGYRLICSNGMIIGQTFSKISRRHTKGLDIDYYINQIQGMTEGFTEQVEVWKDEVNVKLTTNNVIDFLDHIDLAEKDKKYIGNQYLTERHSLGDTKWALNNAITHWSTHSPVQEKSKANKSNIVYLREQKVQQIFNSHAWRKVA